MAVTVNDVRVCLNEISEKDLATATIEQKIADAILWINSLNLSGSAEEIDRAIRDVAAWWSYLVSDIYVSMKIGDLSVRMWVEKKVALLKEIAMQSLKIAGHEVGQLIITGTPMFDDRPEDPYPEAV